MCLIHQPFLSPEKNANPKACVFLYHLLHGYPELVTRALQAPKKKTLGLC